LELHRIVAAIGRCANRARSRAGLPRPLAAYAAQVQRTWGTRYPKSLSRILESELVANQAAEAIANLGVSWNRGLSIGLGIHIDIVPATVSMEDASGGFQFLDKIAPFHAKTSISLV
jgi:hypothetical protein